MPAELRVFNNLVRHDIPDFVERNCRLSQPLFYDIKALIQREAEQVRDVLIDACLHPAGKDQVMACARRYRLALIKLIGELRDYVNPQKTERRRSEDGDVLCQYMYRSLEELLVFVEKQFPECVHPDSYLPRNFALAVSYQLKRDMEHIKATLVKLNVDFVLVDIVLHPVKEFVLDASADFGHVTASRWVYVRNMVNEICRKIRTYDGRGDMKNIVLTLLYNLNFNTGRFFGYCIGMMEGKGGETGPGQWEMLASWKKRLHQWPVHEGLCYNPQQPPLKERLIDWIEERMKFLENIRAGTESKGHNNSININVSVEPDKFPSFEVMIRDHRYVPSPPPVHHKPAAGRQEGLLKLFRKTPAWLALFFRVPRILRWVLLILAIVVLVLAVTSDVTFHFNKKSEKEIDIHVD